MLIVAEGVAPTVAEVCFQTTNGKVHVRHLPGVGVELLTIDSDITQVALMLLNELGTLHKHTTGATGRVIDTTLEGLKHFYDSADNAGRGVEFTTRRLGFSRKVLQAVFIHAAEEVDAFALCMHIHVVEDFNDLAQADLVNLRTGVVVGHHLLQAGILTANLFKGMVDDLSYLRAMRLAGYDIPSSILWHPENMLCGVFIAVFLEAVAFVNKFFVTLLETIADIFKEDETQHHILIL